MNIRKVTRLFFLWTIVQAVIPEYMAGIQNGLCSFENQSTCGYNLHTRWKIHNGPFVINDRLNLTSGHDDIYYAIFDTTMNISKEQENTIYNMTSPVYPPGEYLLSFWYVLKSFASHLEVDVSSAHRHETLLNITGMTTKWIEATRNIHETEYFQVVFQSYMGYSTRAVVGVDAINLIQLTPWNLSESTTVLPKSVTLTTVETGFQLEDAIFPACTISGWNISINMALLKRLYPGITFDNIYFGESSCRGQENGSMLLFQQGFKECLTSEKLSSGNLIYENELLCVVFDPVNKLIIREHKWTFTVECDVSRNEATSTHVHHDVNTHHATVTGHYDINMAFYSDQNLIHQLVPPLHVNVGDIVYVKVFTTITDWKVKMRLHTCFTKPADNADDKTKYYIIKDGCEMDANTHIITHSSHETQFVFQEFEFSTNREGLDISCNVTFCAAEDFSQNCLQICTSPNLIGK